MNYNYPQPQYSPQQQYSGYSSYKQSLQYPQWSPVVTPTAQVRPVSSIEEVKACPIDFDGSVFYFADVANKRIYTKQINLDGTASINVYELKVLPQTDQSTNSFITRQEFEITINQLKEMYDKLIAPINSNVEETSQITAQQQEKPTTQFIF